MQEEALVATSDGGTACADYVMQTAGASRHPRHQLPTVQLKILPHCPCSQVGGLLRSHPRNHRQCQQRKTQPTAAPASATSDSGGTKMPVCRRIMAARAASSQDEDCARWSDNALKANPGHTGRRVWMLPSRTDSHGSPIFFNHYDRGHAVPRDGGSPNDGLSNCVACVSPRRSMDKASDLH